MSYPWTTAQIEAIARLAQYNGNPYNATTNPKGLANGGHRINFAPANNDTSTAAGAIKDAADYVGQQAGAASDSATAAAQSAAKMSGTSTTAVAIGSGSKSFTTQAGKFFEVGRTLRIVSAANPNTAYMVGKVTAYSGTALTVNVLIFVGTGSPADWQIYVDGELGPSGTLAFSGVTALAPDQAPTVTNSGTASAAVLALGIPRGMPAGLYFRWSTVTTATDPGAGRVKVGSASLTTATALYISETDAAAVAQSAVIASWDDSTNPIRGQLRIEDIANPANFVVYNVTGDLVDNGSWNTLPVAYVDKGGTLADGASVRLEYRATGNVGTPGLPGANGAAASIAVESTDTGAAGTPASVTNVGDSTAARLKFTIPRGPTGATGPVVATRFNFDTVTTDADPSNGNVRFNNATPSSVTLIYLDNVEAAGGITVSSFIDTFDDSTNPSGKGTLTFKDVNDPSKFVIFTVTGAVVDGSGYRKVPVTWVAGSGGFTAGAALGMSFDRAGDKGADGGGAGNVVGPATATDGGFALFSGTTGKLLQSGQAPGALAYKTSINNNDWSGAALSIGNGGTGAATVMGAQQNLNLVPGTHVQAYSAKLAALDGLTWAANKGVYFTSASAVATYDLTAFGRSLDGSADAAAAQATLQLRPGIEVQAFNANLAALSGLTGAADKLAYFTGAGALSLADFSPFTRSLTGGATAAAWRTALGLGTAATRDAGTAAGNLPILDTNGYLSAAVQPQITGGDVTAPAGSAVHTIAADAVTNTKLANMPAGTIKGNYAGTVGDPVDLTGAQANTILPVFTADTGAAAGLKGLVPAPAAGDAAAGKVLGAGGGWVVPTSGGGGGISGARAIAAADTIVASDKGKVLNLSGSFTLSATAAATLGNGFYCYLRKADGNGAVVFDPNAAETINGLTSINIYQEDFLVWTDGTAWFSQGRRKGWVPVASVALTGQSLSALTISTGLGDPEIAELEIVFDSLTLSASSTLRLRAAKGGTLQSGSTYNTQGYQANAGNIFGLATAAGSNFELQSLANDAGPYTGSINLKDVLATNGQGAFFASAVSTQTVIQGAQGYETTAGSLTGVSIYPNAGTISAVRYTVKGFRK